MKTSRGKGRSSSSRAIQRKRIGTPGKSGVGFEAAVGNGCDSAETVTETFSYDDVSDLSTLKPTVTREGKGGPPKTKTSASRNGKRANGEGTGEKRQEDYPEDTSTEEEERGSSSRRNRRQKTCAASVATKTSTALDDRRTAEGDNGLVCSVVHKNGVSNSGGSNGNHLVEESAAVIKEIAVPGAENSGMVRACRRANGDSGKKKKKGPTGRNRAHKLLPYPELPFVPSGKARNMTEILEEVVTSEIQGLIRVRGHEPACKEAVKACIDVAKEINRQAGDITGDLGPLPQFNIKGLKMMLEQQRHRQRSLIEEETKMWDAEEQKCLARVEKNKLAQGKVDAGGSYEEVMHVLGEEDRDEEDPPHPLLYSEGVGTEKRVSDMLLRSTLDMLLNARAIGRSLQETGAGCADAQEVKERLGRAYQQYAFQKYPHFDDPKAGIASMLK